MKLIKTIQKLVAEAERDYYIACEKCEDERTIKRLEKNYLDSLKLLKKINNMDNNNKEDLS